MTRKVPTIPAQIAAQEALIKRLEKEEARDVKETQERIDASVAARKADTQTGTQVYKNLAVSWEEDGKPKSVSHQGDLTPAEFRRAVMNLPRVVGDHQVRTAQGRGAQLPTRFQLVAEYRRRAQERQTKIFHAQETIVSLQGTRKR